MAQEIEIEYKVLLTKDEYERIASGLPFPTNAITQTNYYFETKNLELKKHRSALRIREKHNHYTLTLKQPHEDGILETHDELMEDEFLSWVNENATSKPHVGEQLRKMGIQEENLLYYGFLTTKRKAFQSNEILYVLDESTYNGKMDYELEIEAPTKEKGFKAFSDLLKKYHISPKKPITKIERFFNSL